MEQLTKLQHAIRRMWSSRPSLDYMITAALAIIPFVNVYRCGFAFDDHVAIANNRDVIGLTSIFELFTHDFWSSPIRSEMSHKSYRPLTTLSFRLTHLLFGMRKGFFHVENVLYHAVACMLLLRYLRLVVTRPTALLAAVLFALHPVHVEAVTGTVGRAELLSAAAFFIALHLYERILAQERRRRLSLTEKEHLHTAAQVHVNQSAVDSSGSSDEEFAKLDPPPGPHIDEPQSETAPKPPPSAKLDITPYISAAFTASNWYGPLLMAPFALAAMFFKEQGITFLGVLLALEVWRIVSNSRVFRKASPHVVDGQNLTTLHVRASVRIGVLLAVSISLLALRLYIMKSTLPQFKWYDNPALFQPTPTRQLTWFYLPVINLRLLLFPFRLLCDYGMGTVPLLKSPLDPRFWFALSLYGTLAALLVAVATVLRRHVAQRTTVLIAAGLIVIPFLPSTNLLFPVGFVVAERVLYMSSAGWCLLVAYGATKILRKIPLLSVFLVLYIAVCGARIYVRNIDWQTERQIFNSALRVTWRNAKMFNNVGHSYEHNPATNALALQYFRIASKSQPDDIGAWMNVARAYKSLRDFEKAEKIYVYAAGFIPKPKSNQTLTIQLSPKELSIYLDLGDLISDNGTRHDEALVLARYVQHMRPDFPLTYRLFSKVLSKEGNWTQLEEILEKAIPTLLHKDDELTFALAVTYRNLNKTRQALEMYEETLRLNPKHHRALNEWAQLIMVWYNFDFDRMQRAFARLEQAYNIALEAGGELAQFHAFVLANATAVHKQDTPLALAWLKKSLEVDETFISAMLMGSNLAYREKYYDDALFFTTRLTDLQPENVKAWLVIGDLYLKRLGNAGAAQEAFLQAKKHEPGNLDAGLNYCSAFVVLRQFEDALQCYEEFKKIIPAGDPMSARVDGIVAAVEARQFG